jgi:hypothetical protein
MTVAARAINSASASQSHYHSLRADFDAAYRRMMDLSREFNAVLITVPAELSPEERQARKNRAAKAYEDAHDQFLAAVARLHRFMIDRIVSAHGALQPAQPQAAASSTQTGFRQR